jgi:hypothetical protein
MGQLTNLYVSESYQGLLKLANSTTGVTGTLQYVQDGLGNNIPMLVSTSSVVITGSFRGDGSGLTGITVDSGSLVTTASFNAYTSSNDNRVNSLIASTGSYATTSSLTSLSQSIASTDLAQDNRLTAIEGVTSSFASTASLNSYTLTSSFNAYTSSANGRLSSLESATASLQNQINQKLDTGSFNAYTSSNDAKVNSLIAATASYVTETESGSFLITGSASGNVLTFTKGNGSQFNLTVDTGSNSNRNGLITTGSIGQTQSITGSLNVEGTISATSASFTYVTTVFETASVIFSSGSNQLGDEASDTQTLVGDVNLPSGSLRVDNISNWTTGGDLIVGVQGSGDLILNGSGASISLLRTGSNQWVSINSDTEVTGTLKVTGGITGSLEGTASYATNALSSSHAINADTASYVLNAVSSSYSDFAVSSSQAQNAVSASQAQNAVTASYANDIDRTGLITTGSAAAAQSITGSVILSGSAGVELDVKGDVLITGSIIMSGSIDIELDVKGDQTNTGSLTVRSGSLFNISNGTTVNINNFLTSSLAGQSNMVFGWSDNPAAVGAGATQANYTGSLRITGSNNIVNLPQIRATLLVGPTGTDLQGYISGSGNWINSNAAGIFLNTGSLLFPKTQNNILGNGSSIVMNFTTSSLAGGHPIISNNLVIGGALTVNSNSGSITSAASNALLGGGITSTQNFVTNTRPTISANNVIGQVTLNHISSSINYQNNYNNSPIIINNHLSSSNITNNSFTFSNNSVFGGSGNTGLGVWVSGSQSSNATRQVIDNLIGGKNIVVSSSFVSSSASNVVASLVYGQGLGIIGNHSGNVGGTAILGRFNDTGSLGIAQDIVFAVGTGTAAATRRTGLYVTSGSLVGVSGSLAVTGSLGVSGSSNFIGGTVRISGSEFRTNNFVIYDGSPNDPGAMSNFVGTFMSDRNTFTFNNILQSQLSTGSNFSITTNTGATFTNITFDASYAGTDTIFNIGNYNGFRNVDVITDTMTVTGSLGISNLATSTGSFVVTTDNNGTLTKTTYSGLLSASFNVGTFYDTTTQSGSAAVSQSINFNTTDISQGVTVASNSRLTLANAGTYNIQFSAQLLADTGADNVWIWLKKNGTNVSDSAGKITLANNEALIATWNYVVTASPSDYFEIVWQNLNGDAVILAETASGNIPGIPSIITTVTQVR